MDTGSTYNSHVSEKCNNTILIVEDDEAIAQIIVLSIEEETAFQAIYTLNAYDALHRLDEIRPCLLLIDYQLPGMNGLEFYDRVCEHSQLSATPAIMMSANLPWSELRKRQLPGLEKPFDLDVLLTMVEAAVK